MAADSPRHYADRPDEPGCKCENCAQARLITRLSDAVAQLRADKVELTRERDDLATALVAVVIRKETRP